MRNYLIRAALTAALYHERAPQVDIDRYEDRTKHSPDLDNYPCPACYIRGDDVKLILRMRGEWVDMASCPTCNQHWDVPVPKQ